MFQKICFAFVFFVVSATTQAAVAEPFDEVMVGLPVPSLDEAVVWYKTFLGPDVEMIKPAPGVAEFKIAPGVGCNCLKSMIVNHQAGLFGFQ